MSNKIQLTIADPCHENWDNMTRAEKGRFCASCQKQVIDFTNMSDSQLAAFFKKPMSNDGSVCGRFHNDQLDRDIEIPKKRIPWVKYFFQFALPAFLVSMKATAQGKVRARERIVTVQRSPIIDSVARPNLSMLVEKSPINVPVNANPACLSAPIHALTGKLGGIVVRRHKPTREEKRKQKQFIEQMKKEVSIAGKVVDNNDEPIPYATIMIKGSKTAVAADSNGVFNIDNLDLIKDIIMQVSSVGFKSNEISIDRQPDLDNLVIRLESANELPGVVVQAYGGISCRSVTGAVTMVRKLTPGSANNEEKLPLTATLYPNPVQRSGNFYVAVDNAKDELMQLSIIGMNGNIVLNRTETIRKGFNRIQVNIQPSWAAGTFVVQLLNEKGEVVKSEKLIVQ